MSFKEKKVLVTGGCSGIGAGIALQFADEGAEVAIVDRDIKKMKEFEEQISKSGYKFTIIAADLSKDEDVKRTISEAIEGLGSLDVLVNSAGIAVMSTIYDEDFVQAFDTQFATNFRAIVYLTHLAIPYLVASKGNVINISSLAGEFPVARLFGYCAAKSALDMFTQSTASELGTKGVRINNILPGPTDTNIIVNMGMTRDHSGGCWDVIKKYTSTNRINEPDDIAYLALFLASYKARGLTGNLIRADNGMFVKT